MTVETTAKPGKPSLAEEHSAPRDEERSESHKKAQGFEDTDLVTVLHGWGRVAANDRHYIDRVLFLGGVAANVPYDLAKHWLAGTRPDGKPTLGKVVVHIVPNDATEADYIKASGIQPMAAERLAAMLSGCDLDAIFAALGSEKALQISEGLRSRIAGKPAK